MAYHLSKDRFADLVEQALESLPEQFAKFLEEVPVEIRDHPTSRQLHDADLKDNELLLGLYHGRPRTVRSVEDHGTMPDVIYIFQDHLEAISGNRQQLTDEVRTTVLHEIGHHFGMSEKDLEALGY